MNRKFLTLAALLAVTAVCATVTPATAQDKMASKKPAKAATKMGGKMAKKPAKGATKMGGKMDKMGGKMAKKPAKKG